MRKLSMHALRKQLRNEYAHEKWAYKAASYAQTTWTL